jgi:hypothetical protein
MDFFNIFEAACPRHKISKIINKITTFIVYVIFLSDTSRTNCLRERI